MKRKHGSRVSSVIVVVVVNFSVLLLLGVVWFRVVCLVCVAFVCSSKTTPCVRSTRPRVCLHRVAPVHGDVVDGHTGFFRVYTTTQQQHDHNTTNRQRHRETAERGRDRERRQRKRRQEKTDEEKTREEDKTTEKKKKRDRDEHGQR